MRNKTTCVLKCPLRKMHSCRVSQHLSKKHVAHSKSGILHRVYLQRRCLRRQGAGKPSEIVQQPRCFSLFFLFWAPETQWQQVSYRLEGHVAHRQRGAELIDPLPPSSSGRNPDASGIPYGVSPVLSATQDRERAWREDWKLPSTIVSHILNKMKRTNIVSNQLKKFLKRIQIQKTYQKGEIK